MRRSPGKSGEVMVAISAVIKRARTVWKAPPSSSPRMRRRPERGDPVEPGRLDVLGDPGVGDHASVTHQDHVVEAEALLQLGDL